MKRKKKHRSSLKEETVKMQWFKHIYLKIDSDFLNDRLKSYSTNAQDAAYYRIFFLENRNRIVIADGRGNNTVTAVAS